MTTHVTLRDALVAAFISAWGYLPHVAARMVDEKLMPELVALADSATGPLDVERLARCSEALALLPPRPWVSWPQKDGWRIKDADHQWVAITTKPDYAEALVRLVNSLDGLASQSSGTSDDFGEQEAAAGWSPAPSSQQVAQPAEPALD